MISRITEPAAAAAFSMCPPGSFLAAVSILTGGLPASLPIGDDRAGEGHRADPDAEDQFDRRMPISTAVFL
jgi:hypothetical protein